MTSRSSLNTPQIPKQPTAAPTKQEPAQQPAPATTSSTQPPKIVITGDDILIEYVQRVSTALATISEELIPLKTVSKIEKFVTHHIWH